MTDHHESRPLHGSLQRILSQLVVDGPDEYSKLESDLGPLRGGDFTQMAQVPVNGIASSEVVFDNAEITFDNPFILYDPSASDFMLANPQFTTGVEIVSMSGHAVLTAYVSAWTVTEEGWITGATVRIAAYAPGGDSVDYDAIVHLAFTGFAVPSSDEDPADDDS